MAETRTDAFRRRTYEALSAFPRTVGQCVALCAFISSRLTEDLVRNRVALGSLSCNGVKTFQYTKPVPAKPTASFAWDGHAWIDFDDGMIGEPSLFRTARALPRQSRLRQNLEFHGLIDRGALLISVNDALTEYGLKYRKIRFLSETAFLPLIAGLEAGNAPSSTDP